MNNILYSIEITPSVLFIYHNVFFFAKWTYIHYTYIVDFSQATNAGLSARCFFPRKYCCSSGTSSCWAETESLNPLQQ